MRVRGKTTKKTTDEYQDELNNKFNGNIICLDDYILSNIKIQHKCLKHDYIFLSTPQCVLTSSTGCLLCGKELSHSKRAIGDDKYKEIIYEKFNGNIECLETYKTINTPIKHMCHKHNYIYITTPQSILYNTTYGCKFCALEIIQQKQSKGIEQFKKEVYELVKDEYIVEGDYINYHTPVHFIHNTNNETHEFDMTPAVFMRGGRCYCCNPVNKVVVGFNDLYTTHPDLCNYLLDKNDGYKYSKSSKESVEWVCPQCNTHFKQIIADVVKCNNISCPCCSDGISYPNKFIFILLNEFIDEIDYLEREYSPEWCIFNNTNTRGKYDIYFIYKGMKYIVEMDGGLHYKEYNNNSLSLAEIKERDKEKNNLALQNNITIVRINCDYDYPENRLEYIVNNIKKSILSDIFDLTNVDFNEINKKCEKSIIIKSGELWNEGYNSKEIRELLNIGETTVASYLKRCANMGLITYDKTLSFNRSVGTKVKYLPTGKVYDTVISAHNDTHVAKNTIYRHARNITKTAHDWEFV